MKRTISQVAAVLAAVQRIAAMTFRPMVWAVIVILLWLQARHHRALAV